MRKPPSPERVRLEAEAARFLVEKHKEEIAGDYEVQLSIIEGETTLLELLQSLLDEIDDDESLIAGLETRIKEYQSRKERLERRVEKRRELMLRSMEIAELSKAPLPNGTPCAQPKRRGIDPNTLDESQVPSHFFDDGKPKLNRKRLLDAMLAGEAVPGASLTNGGLTLTIRRS